MSGGNKKLEFIKFAVACCIIVVTSSNGSPEFSDYSEDPHAHQLSEYDSTPDKQHTPFYPDGYETAYNLQRALPRGPIRRQAAIDALNVLDILGFSTGAGFLVDGFNAYYTSQVDRRQRDTCNRVNDILQVSDLDGSSYEKILPKSSNYILAGPILGSIAGAAGTFSGGATGLTTLTTIGDMGNTLATSALSVTDFNTLRINIAKAISVLDTKIDEILSVPTLSCSTVA